MTRALVIALLAACTARSVGPTAIVRFVAPEEWSHDDRIDIADGLEAWRELGFELLLEAESELPRCPNNWAAIARLDCVIVIGLRREAGMMTTYKARGMADRVTDSISVDELISGKELAHVVAHEVGHIILNTAQHVRSYGVMLSGGYMTRLSAQDRALACETIKRGCK